MHACMYVCMYVYIYIYIPNSRVLVVRTPNGPNEPEWYISVVAAGLDVGFFVCSTICPIINGDASVSRVWGSHKVDRLLRP